MANIELSAMLRGSVTNTRIVGLTLAWLSCAGLFGQKLVEDKVDEFTKQTIKRTSWEKFVGGGGMTVLSTNLRVSKVDAAFWIELKMMHSNSVYSIPTDGEFMFKLNTGDVVTLHNHQFEITCSGCGAVGFVGSTGMGMHTHYAITLEEIQKLNSAPIEKVRIYTSDGYIEREVSLKESARVQKALALVTGP